MISTNTDWKCLTYWTHIYIKICLYFKVLSQLNHCKNVKFYRIFREYGRFRGKSGWNFDDHYLETRGNTQRTDGYWIGRPGSLRWNWKYQIKYNNNISILGKLNEYSK